jgi:hypothetical protein
VKLINNPNRSMNPFKGQFLLAMRTAGRNDRTKGKVAGAGNYLFNHYMELIELEDYLIEYLNQKVASINIDRTPTKWPIDEDLAKAYLYYKDFFLEREHDLELTEIWTDLRVQVNKVDDFIEAELKEMWERILPSLPSMEDSSMHSSKAYTMIRNLNKKPFFKESLRLMSAWIQLVCKAKNVRYEITEKTTLGGAKYDVFKEVEKSVPVDAQVENAKEIKEKYAEYEKAQLRSRFSASGAYTELKAEDGDLLELYLKKPEAMVTQSDVIAQRKRSFIMRNQEVEDLSRELDSNFITMKEEDVLNLVAKKSKEIIANRVLSKTVYAPANTDFYKNHILYGSGNNHIFTVGHSAYPIKPMQLKIAEVFNKMDLTVANFVEYQIQLQLIVPTNLQVSLKSLITKLKQSKVDSVAKYNNICKQWMNAQGWNIEVTPYKEMLEKLVGIIPSQEAFDQFVEMQNLYSEEKGVYAMEIEPKKEQISKVFKQLAEFEKPNTIVNGKTLQQEVKEKQAQTLKKANVIYSNRLGTIEAENGLSAYEVYQQKRLEGDLRTKTLRDAFPEIVKTTVRNSDGSTEVKEQLVFKHLKKVPVYKKDDAGNIVMQDGKPVQEIEIGRNGLPRTDALGNTIPVFKEVRLNVPPITIDRLSEAEVDALAGVEREIELSDDTAPKANNPLRFAHMVKVKTTTINGITKDIITRGPMKGFSVEDLANATGRLMGKTECYSISANGQIVSTYEIVDTTGGDIKINYPALEEPYITWANGRFLIGFPIDRKYHLERKAIKKLAETRASMEVVAGSGESRWSFYFEGDDYESVKDALGSCLMSRKAHEELKKYYAMILQKDQALKEENLVNYTPEAIGGFKAQVVPNKPFKFNNKQIEALAWLDANKLKGVMALDTGVGKTLVGIASMQIATKEKPNAKFLIVGPDRLVGNFKGELKFFLEEQVAENLLGRTTEIGYTEFVKMYEEGVNFQSTYYCMIFDEVNEALKGKKAQAISGVKHPRKILLTGSALEKSPMDLFRFVSLSTGNPVDPAKEKAFADKFAVNIGGKFVGIKPESRHQFDVWLKQNAYFADKMDVDYVGAGQKALQPLQKVNTQVNMDKVVATAYQDISKDISTQLAQIQQRYSELLSGTAPADLPSALQREKDIAVGNLKDKIALLHMFSLNPHKAMAKYDKLKGKAPKEYTFSNPKVEQAEELAVKFQSEETPKRVIYFTEDNDVAKQTVIKLSRRLASRVHALCLSNMIVFYQAGKPLKKGRVTKKTKIDNFMVNKLNENEIRSRLQEEGFTEEEIVKRMGRTASTANPQDPKEEDMTWAVNTVKKFIAKNNEVVTMVANSSYARGFNLQQFKAVVHLDRDGWDSEEIKQRTARAFRQGQEDAVLEVMVDAVIPSDMQQETTIDQLRGLIHETDQKFFSEIIAKSGAINLSSNYDSIEHSTVTDKATKPNLEQFTRALIPTREVMQKIEEREVGLREDPIKYTVLDPNRFNHPKFQNLTPDQKKKADLIGVSGIANVVSNEFNIGVSGDSGYGDFIGVMERSIHSNYVKNSHFKVSTCAPPAIGNRALFTQLIAMKQNNMSEGLYTYGAGSPANFDHETGQAPEGAYIGFWVWPKFGYNANISLNVSELKDHKNFFEKALQAKIGTTSSVNTNFNLTEPVQPIAPIKPVMQSVMAGITIEGLTSGGQTGMSAQKLLLLNKMGITPQSRGVLEINNDIEYAYFMKRDLEQEKQDHLQNRIVWGYLYQNKRYPLKNKNRKDPLSLAVGSGRFRPQRDQQYMVTYNRDRYEQSDVNHVTIWNNFVEAPLRDYPALCTLFNKIQDENRALSPEEIEEFIVSLRQQEEQLNADFPIKMAEYDRKMEEHNQAMLVYNTAKENYDLELERFKAEQHKYTHLLNIDKDEILADLRNNVYPSEVKNLLENGNKWFRLRYAKAAHIIIESGVVPDSGNVQILDLYAITSTDENGKKFKAGEEWWRYKGGSSNYNLSLDSNSKSYKALTKYMNTKVKEAGFETLEEYLSSPIEPFDTSSYSCWLAFFNNNIRWIANLSVDTKKEIFKTYLKDLKKVIMDAKTPEMAKDLLLKVKAFKMQNSDLANVRVAKQNKFAKEEYMTSEQLMYSIAEQDGDLMTSILEEIANEEKIKQTEKEISVLRGDLKPVSNPFGKKKGNV